MIIWGSRGRETTIAEGEFLCPTCRGTRHYKHRKVARYFTLYFIPIFETKNLGDYIECQTCKTPFKSEVLHLSQSAGQELQAEHQASRIIEVLSRQLEAGIPLDAIVATLKSQGVDEKAALGALMLATDGRISLCDVCGVAYKATLAYCSGCGRPLRPMADHPEGTHA